MVTIFSEIGQMILVTLPDYEMGTRYVSVWAKKMIDGIKNKRRRIIELSRKKVTKKNIESYLAKQPIKLVLFNGHGDRDCILGQDGEILVKVRVNEGILKSKIIHVLACSCAAELGPAAVLSGALAFVGYKKPFAFSHWGKSRNPLKDSRARPFFESANKAAYMLIKGYTVKKAMEKSQDAFGREMDRLVSSEATNDDLLDASLLFWDRQNQVCLGKSEVKI